jgi:hypothetical protein
VHLVDPVPVDPVFESRNQMTDLDPSKWQMWLEWLRFNIAIECEERTDLMQLLEDLIAKRVTLVRNDLQNELHNEDTGF